MAAVSMTMAILPAQRQLSPPVSEASKKWKPILNTRKASHKQPRVEASLKESSLAVAVAGVSAAVASMVIPEVAQAADGMTPSLQNFLLSIGAGGVVLVVIAGAVVGVSNFDPIKRS